MSSNLQMEARVLSAAILLSFCVSLNQPAPAANAKNQADVDAVKTSKDDNQTQTKPARNNHKQGSPLPFEGPPEKSGKDTSTSSSAGADKKP